MKETNDNKNQNSGKKNAKVVQKIRTMYSYLLFALVSVTLALDMVDPGAEIPVRMSIFTVLVLSAMLFVKAAIHLNNIIKGNKKCHSIFKTAMN